MAVQERRERGADYQCFSARLPKDIYNTLSNWAWMHRLSLARACSTLLNKALTAEQGEFYIPEKGAKMAFEAFERALNAGTNGEKE